jgi:hypothetical protein
MSDQLSKPDDSNLIVIYKEILNLRSTVDALQNRICELEKNIAELPRFEKQKRKENVSLSPLQQKIAGFLKEGGKTQIEIAECLKMPQASVSHSLSKLEKELDIVESKPTGKAGARFEYILKKDLSPDILKLLSEL